MKSVEPSVSPSNVLGGSGANQYKGLWPRFSGFGVGAAVAVGVGIKAGMPRLHAKVAKRRTVQTDGDNFFMTANPFPNQA